MFWFFQLHSKQTRRASNLNTNFEAHSVHSMNVSDDRNCFKLLIELSITQIFCTLTGVGFWLPGLPKFREGLSGPLWTREDHFSFSLLQLNPNPWLGELSKYNLNQDRDLLITFYFLSSWTSRSSPHTTRTLRTYLELAGHFITGTVPIPAHWNVRILSIMCLIVISTHINLKRSLKIGIWIF